MIENEKHFQRCAEHIKKTWGRGESGIVDSPWKINPKIRQIAFGLIIEEGEELLGMMVLFDDYVTSVTSVPGKFISHKYIKEIITGVLDEPAPKHPADKFRVV